MKVKELLHYLSKAPENAEVVIDTEGRCFPAHLIRAKSGYFESDKDMGIGGDMFIICPDYEGTTHGRMMEGE